MKQAKLALITGAAGVLGAASARFLAEDGFRLALADLDGDRLAAVKEEVAKASGSECFSIVFDVADSVQVEDSVKTVREKMGIIDVLVNNAGILSKNKVEATTPGEWRRVIQVNLDSIFFMSRAVIPDMKSRGWGRIVNVTSLAAKSGGISAGTAYSASKGGVSSLTFSLAAETAPYGITVNGIAAAYVKTPMIMEQLCEAERERILGKIPVGRFCEPEEFAHVVRFLVSPLAGFITGEIVDLNGGLIFD